MRGRGMVQDRGAAISGLDAFVGRREGIVGRGMWLEFVLMMIRGSAEKDARSPISHAMRKVVKFVHNERGGIMHLR